MNIAQQKLRKIWSANKPKLAWEFAMFILSFNIEFYLKSLLQFPFIAPVFCFFPHSKDNWFDKLVGLIDYFVKLPLVYWFIVYWIIIIRCIEIQFKTLICLLPRQSISQVSTITPYMRGRTWEAISVNGQFNVWHEFSNSLIGTRFNCRTFFVSLKHLGHSQAVVRQRFQ